MLAPVVHYTLSHTGAICGEGGRVGLHKNVGLLGACKRLCTEAATCKHISWIPTLTGGWCETLSSCNRNYRYPGSQHYIYDKSTEAPAVHYTLSHTGAICGEGGRVGLHKNVGLLGACKRLCTEAATCWHISWIPTLTGGWCETLSSCNRNYRYPGSQHYIYDMHLYKSTEA